MTTTNASRASLPTWRVTLKTGTRTWSTIDVPGDDHAAAIRHAQRLLGNYPCTEVI